MKRLLLALTALSISTHVTAYQDNEASLYLEKWAAATKTIICGSSAALLSGAGALLSKPSKVQDPSAMGKFFKGTRSGAALVMFGLATLSAIPAITSGYDWMNLKYRLWQLKNNN